MLRLRAKKDAEEVYDYGTEKIRSLLKRDSKELKVRLHTRATVEA